MPTITIDNIALPSVRTAGNRPAENHMASAISMLLPLASRTKIICPTPVSSPAARRTARCRPGLAAEADSSNVPGPGHAQCCTTRNNSISAAPLAPAPKPMATTAAQNLTAPGCVTVAGILCSADWIVLDCGMLAPRCGCIA